MQLQKMKDYLDVTFGNEILSKFKLFDVVHSIGTELTKSCQKGLLLDLMNIKSPDEVLEVIKSGLRTNFPLLPNLYLAYLPISGESKDKQFESGFTSEGFSKRVNAIAWLQERLS